MHHLVWLIRSNTLIPCSSTFQLPEQWNSYVRSVERGMKSFISDVCSHRLLIQKGESHQSLDKLLESSDYTERVSFDDIPEVEEPSMHEEQSLLVDTLLASGGGKDARTEDGRDVSDSTEQRPFVLRPIHCVCIYIIRRWSALVSYACVLSTHDCLC